MSIPTQIGALRLLAIDLGGGPQLYAVGEFGDLGGGPTGGFARWTGSTWERPLSNLDHFSGVYDAAVYDDGTGQKLYVSSDAYLAGSSEQLDGLAVWDGQSWSNLGGPAGGPGSVYERGLLQVFDDGRGPALFILGAFGHYGGIEAHGIVRWDGNTLEPLGRGISNAGGVYAVVLCPDQRGPSMFFCGEGSSANAGTPAHIVQYVGCPSCYANCDTSTRAPSLNVNDFICYLQRFAALDPYANCNNDATLDVSDFMCFRSRFAAGCP
jgi:hypothetical protein